MVASWARARSVASVRPALVAIVVPLVVLIATACDKAPLTAPTGSTITLYASTTYVPVNGTADITATIFEQAGTPVQNGTEITFTTSLGSIDPQVARTKDGSVTVRFTAGGQSGTAQISAFSGAASGTGTTTGGTGTGTGSTATSGGGKAASIQITVGGAGASRIVVNATPATVPSTGGSITLAATVLDANGNRLPGVPVTFATSAGTLSATTVITGGDGEARTTLMTNRATTVTVSAGAASPVTLNIEANAAPTVVVRPPTTITANQPATFTITTGPTGRVLRDLTIDWGDGRSDFIATQTAGDVPVAHTYRSAGTYTVRATVTDASGDQSTFTTIVSVLPAVPGTITVSASPNPATANQPVTISASVGTGVNVLRYEYDFGDGRTATLNSNQTTQVYRAPGTYTITVTAVTTDNQRIVGQTTIVVES